jgi:hypothetical protein
LNRCLAVLALLAACGGDPTAEGPDDRPTDAGADGPGRVDAAGLAPDASSPDGAFTVVWPADTSALVEPGQVVILEVAGAPPSASYSASIHATPVVVAAAGPGRLLLVVPAEAAGPHTVEIRAGDRRAQVALELSPYAPIAAPASFVAAGLAELDAELTALRADLPDHAEALDEARGWIEELEARWPLLTPAEQAQVAYAMRAAEPAGDDKPAGGFFEPACEASLFGYGKKLVKAVGSSRKAALALTALSFVTGSWIPVGLAAAAVATTRWWRATNDLAQEGVPGVIDSCVRDVGREIDVAQKPALPDAVAGELDFRHGRERLLAIRTLRELPAGVVDELEAGREQLHEAAAALPPEFRVELDEPPGPAWHPGGDVAVYSDDSLVFAELTAAPAGLRFSFWDVHALPTDGWPFTFRLHGPDGLVTTHAARLTGPTYTLVRADGSPVGDEVTFMVREEQALRVVSDEPGLAFDWNRLRVEGAAVRVVSGSEGFSLMFYEPSPSVTIAVSYPSGPLATFVAQARYRTVPEAGLALAVTSSAGSPTAKLREVPCGGALSVPVNTSGNLRLERAGQLLYTDVVSTGLDYFQGTIGPADQPLGKRTLVVRETGSVVPLACEVDVTVTNQAYRGIVGKTFVRRSYEPDLYVTFAANGQGTYDQGTAGSGSFTYTLSSGLRQTSCATGSPPFTIVGSAVTSKYGTVYIGEDGQPVPCPGSPE